MYVFYTALKPYICDAIPKITRHNNESVTDATNFHIFIFSNIFHCFICHFAYFRASTTFIKIKSHVHFNQMGIQHKIIKSYTKATKQTFSKKTKVIVQEYFSLRVHVMCHKYLRTTHKT